MTSTLSQPSQAEYDPDMQQLVGDMEDLSIDFEDFEDAQDEAEATQDEMEETAEEADQPEQMETDESDRGRADACTSITPAFRIVGDNIDRKVRSIMYGNCFTPDCM
jgi:hypothetical protein